MDHSNQKDVFNRFLAYARTRIQQPAVETTDLVADICRALECLLTIEPLEGGEWVEPGDYQGQLLYEDPETGFIAVLMSWGAGARTPIHDHGTWGVFGVWQGQLEFTNFVRISEQQVRPVARYLANPADVGYVIPPDQEIHQIRNPTPEIARSLHLYGVNIGY